MAQPIWITPAGSLGTIPEGIFYQTNMLADTATVAINTCTATSSATNLITCDSTANIWPGLNLIFSGGLFGGVSPSVRYFVLAVPDSTHFSIAPFEYSTTPIPLTNGTGSMTATFTQHVLFTIQAGTLPSGIQISDNGLIEGIPKAVASIQGVPTQVSEDVTSKFTVRGYTRTRAGTIDRINDRTFTLTVTGQDLPEWITPAGQIAQEYDGGQITPIQVEYTDTDPGDQVIVSLKAGLLPPGLTISTTGLISGFIAPLAPVEATAGFSNDGQGYDEYPFDFSTQSVDVNYEFVLELSDGKSSNLRTFSIFVYSKDSLTADTTTITADNTFVTADVSSVRVPFLISPTPGSIGRIRNDNFFAVQFVGRDLDGDPIEYELGYDIGDSTTIPGLTLDPGTGWLYGYIPSLGLTENTYNFYIRVYKKNNPAVISNDYNYSLTIVGPIDTDVTWLVDSDLGTIINGATSTLYVLATNLADIPLQYQLESGSDSSLPQGLQLLPSGEIAGRVSFDTFALDLGSTTFDVTLNNLAITGENTETTFDMTHTFTVNAYSANGLVNVFKTFTITVIREYNEPYENLYIEAMPPLADREFIDSLVQDQDIFQPDLLYRPTDPNFGRATNVVYEHAFGLTASTIEDYYSSLYENHYWKNLTLGEIRVAQAVDANGEVIYEVVYSAIQDNLLNNQGLSVSKQVTLPYPINEADSTEVSVVYPNSLINMRDQVIDTVGQVGSILPAWMTSKQANGRILGFTPSWVLAYVKPGKGEQIAYYVRTKFGERLNLIDFEVDRYELDRLLTKNWDPANSEWEPAAAETTFDLVNHYQLPEPSDSSFAFVGGTDYAVGDRILILGSQVGGVNGTNNITITVEQVDTNGTIEQARAAGFAPTFSTGDVYTNLVGTNITGSSAEFTIRKNAQVYTTVLITDAGSDYNVGSTIVISGSNLGGVSPANNATITVTEIDSNGGVVKVTVNGTASTGDATYTALSGTTSEGSGASWDIEVVGADATTFDGSSVRFIAPVDMYSNTQEYDKYLVFPKRTILG
jgi:hypothetical protein